MAERILSQNFIMKTYMDMTKSMGIIALTIAPKLGRIPQKPSITSVISVQFTSAAEAGFISIIIIAVRAIILLLLLKKNPCFFGSDSALLFFRNIFARKDIHENKV